MSDTFGSYLKHRIEFRVLRFLNVWTIAFTFDSTITFDSEALIFNSAG